MSEKPIEAWAVVSEHRNPPSETWVPHYVCCANKGIAMLHIERQSSPENASRYRNISAPIPLVERRLLEEEHQNSIQASERALKYAYQRDWARNMANFWRNKWCADCRTPQDIIDPVLPWEKEPEAGE